MSGKLYYFLIGSFLICLAPTPNSILPVFLLEIGVIISIFSLFDQLPFLFGFLLFVFFQVYVLRKANKSFWHIGEKISLTIALVVIDAVLAGTAVKAYQTYMDYVLPYKKFVVGGSILPFMILSFLLLFTIWKSKKND